MKSIRRLLLGIALLLVGMSFYQIADRGNSPILSYVGLLADIVGIIYIVSELINIQKEK